MSDFLSNFENKKEKSIDETLSEKPIVEDYSEVTSNTDSNNSAFSEEVFVVDKEYVKNKMIKRIATVFLISLFMISCFAAYKIFAYVDIINVTNMKMEDAYVWTKKHKLNLIVNEEYSDTIEKNYIISQEKQSGTKIKKGSTMVVTVSVGPDPEVVVSIPDFNEMNRLDIENWISENKLENVSVRTVFDSSIESGNYVSHVMTDGTVDYFKRKNRLTIYVSKGPEPVSNDVTIIDFKNQTIESVKNWAKENELVLNISRQFNQSISKDLIISQSISPNTKIEKGSKIDVVVSDGKSVKVPSFNNYSKDEILAWATKNEINVIINEYYEDDYQKGQFISQSHKPNSYIGIETDITVDMALGRVVVVNKTGCAKYEFYEFVKLQNDRNANLKIIEKKEYSADTPKNNIIYHSNINEKVSLDASLTIVVSLGERYSVENLIGLSEDDARNSGLCSKMTCVFEKEADAEDTANSGKVVKQSLSAGTIVGLPEMIVITIRE